MDMNIRLKGKYLRKGAPLVIGYPARPRTDNSHGPVRDKLPALQPCRRASAGAKVFTPAPQNHADRRRVLIVSAGKGKRSWGWETLDGTPIVKTAELSLAEMGLT